MTLQVANLKHKPLLTGSMPYFSVILKRPEKPAVLTLVYTPPRLKLRCSSGTMFQSACPKSPIMSTQTYPASAFPCGDTESWQLQSTTCVRLGKPGSSNHGRSCKLPAAMLLGPRSPTSAGRREPDNRPTNIRRYCRGVGLVHYSRMKHFARLELLSNVEGIFGRLRSWPPPRSMPCHRAPALPFSRPQAASPNRFELGKFKARSGPASHGSTAYCQDLWAQGGLRWIPRWNVGTM